MSLGAVEGPQSLRMKKLPSSRNGITTVRPAASQWQLRGWRSQSVGKARHRCIATPPVAQRLSQILLKGGGGPPPETCRVVGVGRSAKNTDWKGTAVSTVVLGGRRVKVSRPRARSLEGAEVHLDTYAAFADDDLLGQVVMERMLAGLATRRHRSANEPVGQAVEDEASSTSRSSVSRRFVAGTAKALEDLMARDLSERAVAALMVDGVHFAEHCCDEFGSVPSSLRHASRHQRVHQPRRRRAGSRGPRRGHRRGLPARRVVHAVLRPRGHRVEHR